MPGRKGLLVFVAQRLLWLPVILFVVSLVTFALGRYGPGDPAQIRAGERASPEAVERLREELGLNRPFIVQYGDYISGLFQGDFGESIRYPDFTVKELIFPRIWVSTQYGLLVFPLTLGIGIAVGTAAALWKRNRWSGPLSNTNVPKPAKVTTKLGQHLHPLGRQLEAVDALLKKRSHLPRILREIFKRKLTTLALIAILVLYGAGAFIGILDLFFKLTPFDAPYSFSDQDLTNVLAGPSLAHPFGTDHLGRDQFIRVLYSLQVTVLMTILVIVFGGFTIGIPLGLLAGYKGGWVDRVIDRTGQIVSNLPTFFLMLMIWATLRPRYEPLLGPLGWFSDIIVLFAVLTIFSWYGIFRLVRSKVLSLREEAFIESARSSGATTKRVLFGHIFPNLSEIVIVVFSASLASVAGSEMALSFFGMGIQPPHPSFGQLMAQSVSPRTLDAYPHLLFFPAAVITILLYSFILLGDSLVEIVNPKLKRGSWLDPLLVSIFLFFDAIPVFISIPALLWLFSLTLHWLPAGGWNPILVRQELPLGFILAGISSFLFLWGAWRRRKGFILAALAIVLVSLAELFILRIGAIPWIALPKTMWIPIMVLTLPGVAAVARLMRASILEVIGEDYIRTAYAKGLPPSIVLRRYILRNAMIPMITVIGLSMSGVLTGAFFVETLYGIPGIGAFSVESVFARDYDVIMTLTIFFSTAFLVAQILTDIAYGIIDPRVRIEAAQI